MHIKHKPICHKGRYFHPKAFCSRRSFFDLLLWKMGLYRDGLKKTCCGEESLSIPEHRTFDPSSPSVTWVNHSTFLIKVYGVTILTDPIWSERCFPYAWIGPKRKASAAIPLPSLPKIDCVLISHNHYDHLDLPTIKKLHKAFPSILWIVPLGLKSWFCLRGITNVVELSWWEEKICSFPHTKTELVFTCVPAQHWSSRTFFDYNKTLWSGWVLQGRVDAKSKTCYFAGDTGYNYDDFRSIGHSWQQIDLSLLPIGAHKPKIFQQPHHLSPEEAVLVHKEIKSKLTVAMHYGTFKLGDDSPWEPIHELLIELNKQQIDSKHFRTLAQGYEINW